MSQEAPNWTSESPLLIENKFTVICILFTGIVLAGSTLGLVVEGFDSTTDDLHIWARFAIVFIAIGSLYIFDWLQSWSLPVVHAIHYILTMAIILVSFWFMGTIIELHPDAYRDIILNYSGIYLILVAVEYVYFRWRGRKRALRIE